MAVGFYHRCCSCSKSTPLCSDFRHNAKLYDQTAVNHLLGKVGAYFATALICLVIAGSALGNSFVAGRMTVAAANKKWLPAAFSTVGHIGAYKFTKGGANEENAEGAADKGQPPMYISLPLSLERPC